MSCEHIEGSFDSLAECFSSIARWNLLLSWEILRKVFRARIFLWTSRMRCIQFSKPIQHCFAAVPKFIAQAGNYVYSFFSKPTVFTIIGSSSQIECSFDIPAGFSPGNRRRLSPKVEFEKNISAVFPKTLSSKHFSAQPEKNFDNPALNFWQMTDKFWWNSKIISKSVFFGNWFIH